MHAAAPIPTAPRFEHCADSLGIGVASPRLSWRTDAEPGWCQRAYEVRVRRGTRDGRFDVKSPESVLVPWPDSPLHSRERAEVYVRVVGTDGSVSPWSAPGFVEAGLLDPLDWTAAGIMPAWREGASDVHRRPPLFRREFHIDAPVVHARLYVTAHGLYEMEINGHRVGDEALSPGWTVYPARLRYATYDVTDLLEAGDNAVGAWLGDGWWRGRYGFHGGTSNIYGTDIALLAQIEITLVDGRTVTVGTDRHWRASPSPIVESGLYDGETFDATAYQSGWSTPGFDARGWSPVKIAEFAPGTFVAPDGPPVRCTQEMTPASVTRIPGGRLLVDFGQNFCGRLHVTASGGVGHELVIRHAEVVVDGHLYVRTLRGAASVDRYLGSTGTINWEPRFTIHGFRYAEISGYNGDLSDIEIVGRVYHSDMRRTGWLETSDPELNRLHENVVWSMRSNFVDIPTDCPQRDERLGWTGDIQVFAPTASYLYDCAGFLSSWLKDVAVEQTRFGTVPWYVPVIPGAPQWTPIVPGAAWGDVAALAPYALYERFGDRDILRRQYPSARAWVDQVERLAGPSRLWDTGKQLGDWLDPTAPPENPAHARTDPYLVATAFFAWSTTIVARSAAILDEADDAQHYGRLAAQIRRAFRARWCTSEGLMTNETQTAYALAIAFDLIANKRRAGTRLAALVRAEGNRISAGFAGVNLLSDALTITGHADVAFDLLMEKETPSWLSMVRKGATTIWERWDSQLDDGSVNPGEMTSFNHYALGSIADWMHREIGGIQPAAPGYRRVRIAPRIGGGLTWAKARHDSPYGTIGTSWNLQDGEFELEVVLPIGVEGTVALPDGRELEVGPGCHRLTTRAVDFRRANPDSEPIATTSSDHRRTIRSQ